jgi:type II secretory pathway component PulF
MGALPDMLTELSAHLNEETKRLSSIFSSIIEPLILTVGGILVGALLTSFFMPVFTLLTKIK